jgi:hypothetical protein
MFGKLPNESEFAELCLVAAAIAGLAPASSRVGVSKSLGWPRSLTTRWARVRRREINENGQ